MLLIEHHRGCEGGWILIQRRLFFGRCFGFRRFVGRNLRRVTGFDRRNRSFCLADRSFICISGFERSLLGLVCFPCV